MTRWDNVGTFVNTVKLQGTLNSNPVRFYIIIAILFFHQKKGISFQFFSFIYQQNNGIVLKSSSGFL